jgi:1-acyl-sn-glycerol-3-phosphate acyltransferase
MTRPIAARDYWDSGIRHFMASRVFDAILVQRGAGQAYGDTAALPTDRSELGRVAVAQMLDGMGADRSLIIFPEGQRSSTDEVLPFKTGLVHLAEQRPDLEFVPVYLENISRVLPKGEILPVPMMSRLTFGPPVRFESGEDKQTFLDRARAALLELRV